MVYLISLKKTKTKKEPDPDPHQNKNGSGPVDSDPQHCSIQSPWEKCAVFSAFQQEHALLQRKEYPFFNQLEERIRLEVALFAFQLYREFKGIDSHTRLATSNFGSNGQSLRFFVTFTRPYFKLFLFSFSHLIL